MLGKLREKGNPWRTPWAQKETLLRKNMLNERSYTRNLHWLGVLFHRFLPSDSCIMLIYFSILCSGRLCLYRITDKWSTVAAQPQSYQKWAPDVDGSFGSKTKHWSWGLNHPDEEGRSWKKTVMSSFKWFLSLLKVGFGIHSCSIALLIKQSKDNGFPKC